MSKQYDDHNSEWNPDTEPIDLGAFNDYADAMEEREALKHRVESLEATLSDIQTSAETAQRLIDSGLFGVTDFQRHLDNVIRIASNARPIIKRGTPRKGGAL